MIKKKQNKKTPTKHAIFSECAKHFWDGYMYTTRVETLK